jgi:transglutaminase-like putative cysteine protease
MRLSWRLLREDLPTFGFLAILLFLASASIIVAAWTDILRGLATITLLGLLAGYFLARSGFSEVTALLIASIYGAFVIGLQQTLTLASSVSLQARSLEIVRRVSAWIASAASGGFNQDDLVFVVVLAVLFWFLGYNASWNMFRGERLWRAVVPPGIALLVNIGYYVGEARLEVGLLAYLLVALLLAVRTNTLARESLWRDRHMSVTPGIRFDLLRAGFLASVALLALAWLVPTARADERLASAWEEQVAPRVNLQDAWNRLFSLEGGARNAVANYYGGQTLTLSGEINLSDTPVMDVYAPLGPRYYWRSKVFDTFDGRTWTTVNDARLGSEFGVLYYEDASYKLRRNVRQRFEIHIPASRLVYSAPQPSSVSLPVIFDVLYIDRSQERGTVNELRAESLLHDGDSYEAISSVSYADETSLRAAGTDYPGWVWLTYLQIPESTTPRTRNLAAELAAPYDNPYDKAQAIESWLRQNIVYEENISAPPPNADAVDWMLFERREGYCNYYASAMVVMLRSQDIPARVATGFAQGEYETRREAFHVLESDAHTWVEVYFPGYGWIEFEPTAAQSPIEARGDVAAGGAGGAAISPNQPPDAQEPPSPGETEDVPLPGNLGGGEGFLGALGTDSPVGRFWRTTVWVIGTLALAVVIGAILGWREIEQRGLRGLSGVARAYAMLNVAASWLGLRLPPSFTPGERAAALSVEMPEAAVPAHEIAAFYVRERFSIPPIDAGDKRAPPDASPQTNAAWQALRSALARRMLRRILRLRRKEE